MIKKLPKEFLSVISENNGLRVYLSNLSKGREFTPRSWLYEDMNPDSILDEWLNVLSELENGDTFEKKVFQFDTSQMKKWGPQGGILPIQDLLKDIVMPTFAGGDSPRPKAYVSKQWSQAKEETIREFRSHAVFGLRPATYSNVVADMRARDTLESNSGWPDFTRRNKPEVLQRAISDATNGEWIDFPAIALFRNYNLKTRLVWMFPEATNINEGSFCQPIQSRMINSKLPFYCPWVGFEAVRDLITSQYENGAFLTASDFSSTDAHFQLPSTLETYDVLKFLLQRGHTGGLRQSLIRMHEIPLIIGPDEMLAGKHGVASGSNWTNFIETVFDRIFSFYVETETNSNTRGLCAIGDDMCWVSERYDDALAQKLEHCGEDVGQALNAEKVTNDQDSVKFLQRLFQRGYRRPDGKLRGVYSTIRALKSSVYPERYHKPQDWSSDMFCARQFMILENCVDHPLFERFVKFVCDGQKDLIPFASKSDAALTKITRETKLIPGFNPTYNQEKRESSLANFESVKLARTF